MNEDLNKICKLYGIKQESYTKIEDQERIDEYINILVNNQELPVGISVLTKKTKYWYDECGIDQNSKRLYDKSDLTITIKDLYVLKRIYPDLKYRNSKGSTYFYVIESEIKCYDEYEFQEVKEKTAEDVKYELDVTINRNKERNLSSIASTLEFFKSLAIILIILTVISVIMSIIASCSALR